MPTLLVIPVLAVEALNTRPVLSCALPLPMQLAALTSWRAFISFLSLSSAARQRMRSASESLEGSSLRRAWFTWRARVHDLSHLSRIARSVSAAGRALHRALNIWSERSINGLRHLVLLHRALLGRRSRLLWGILVQRNTHCQDFDWSRKFS